MKIAGLIILSILLTVISNAQSKKTKLNLKSDYFVTKNGDTTFCKNLSYNTTGQGYLKQIEYEDHSGNKMKIKVKDDAPDVVTFQINNITFDKIPLKADKPDGYIRYTNRVVDGTLKVYLAQQGRASIPLMNYKATYSPIAAAAAASHPAPGIVGNFSSGSSPVGIYTFFIEMPDGIFYEINSRKNMKEYIKPFLLNCEEFKNKYKGDFSKEEEPFMEMINLYNAICK